MPKIPKPLNDKEVKAYKPKEKRQKIADENGHISFSEAVQHFVSKLILNCEFYCLLV